MAASNHTTMNVAYILSATTAAGGATKSFLTLMNALRQRGITPTVVVPDADGITPMLRKQGIDTIILAFRPNTYPDRRSVKENILFLPRLIARRMVNAKAVRVLTCELSKRNIQVIHTNVSIIDIGFRTAQKLHIPHIYHIREYGDSDFHKHYFPTWNSFHRTLHKPQSYSICITRDIQRHHQLTNEAQSMVIYNGIDVTTPTDSGTTTNQGKESGGNYFLYAGRIEPAKGLLFLLRAYAAYASRGNATPLHIAGKASDSTYMEQVETFIKEHHLQHLVTFLGERTDMPALMSKARAIIIPSRFEAFGRCMAEAMMCRCIVIGRNTGGTKEQFDNGLQLTNGEIGFRFSTERDLQDILTQFTTIGRDTILTMRTNAQLTANHYYSVEAYTQSVYQFYQRITDEKHN